MKVGCAVRRCVLWKNVEPFHFALFLRFSIRTHRKARKVNLIIQICIFPRFFICNDLVQMLDFFSCMLHFIFDNALNYVVA